MFNRFLDPKNGVAFKSVFGQEKNKDILIHFLNDVLSHDRIGQIKEVTFLRRAQELKVAPKRQSPIDVRCRDELGRECVAAIDMEVAKRPDYKQRAQYHAAKAYLPHKAWTVKTHLASWSILMICSSVNLSFMVHVMV